MGQGRPGRFYAILHNALHFATSTYMVFLTSLCATSVNTLSGYNCSLSYNLGRPMTIEKSKGSKRSPYILAVF